MNRIEFEEPGTEELIKYLDGQKVVLDADEQTIFRRQKIDGESLLGMTREDLERYGVAGGLTVKIMNRIPK